MHVKVVFDLPAGNLGRHYIVKNNQSLPKLLSEKRHWQICRAPEQNTMKNFTGYHLSDNTSNRFPRFNTSKLQISFQDVCKCIKMYT